MELGLAGKNRKAQQESIERPQLAHYAESQKHWDHWQEDRERAIQTEALRLNQRYQFAGQLGASDHTKAKNALVIQRQPRNTGRSRHQ